MARSKHSNLAAADRFERVARRRNRPVERRMSTRAAVVAAARRDVY